MIKKIQGQEITYILTEKERVFLATDRAKEFVSERLKKIDQYINNDGRAKCFFTDTLLHEDGCDPVFNSKDGWCFNVEKDGTMYDCMYLLDINFANTNNLAAIEAYTFLLWRNGYEGFNYSEHIGDCIDNEDNVYTFKTTTYNECEEALFNIQKEDSEHNIILEEMVLDESNRDFIRKQLLCNYL